MLPNVEFLLQTDCNNDYRRTYTSVGLDIPVFCQVHLQSDNLLVLTFLVAYMQWRI